MTAYPGPALPPNPTRRQRKEHEAAFQKWVMREEMRISRQREMFAMITPDEIHDGLQRAMLDRAEDLLDAGECEAADALLEFVDEAHATALLDMVFGDLEGG